MGKNLNSKPQMKTITFALAAALATLSQTSSAITITLNREENPVIDDDHDEDVQWDGEDAQIAQGWLDPIVSMQALEDENPDGINGEGFAQIAKKAREAENKTEEVNNDRC